jgi:hypothetical protein|tara:strand:+ start:394 stop:660 length:267 start_codon:yes stop_codon:yes gene_type:complete
MAKENQTEEQQPRTYTMEFEGGKKVVKTMDELSGEVVYACEKLRGLNVEIGRLNATLADNTVLRDHYQRIAEPAFKEKEDDSEDSAES